MCHLLGVNSVLDDYTGGRSVIGTCIVLVGVSAQSVIQVVAPRSEILEGSTLSALIGVRTQCHLY